MPVRIRDVVEVLTQRTIARLQRKHEKDTPQKLINFYRDRGLKTLIKDLQKDELLKALGLLDDERRLKAIVYCALQLPDPALEVFNKGDKDRNQVTLKINTLMHYFYGWSGARKLGETSYRRLVLKLNEIGLEVDKSYEQLEGTGPNREQKVTVERMFSD